MTAGVRGDMLVEDLLLQLGLMVARSGLPGGEAAHDLLLGNFEIRASLIATLDVRMRSSLVINNYMHLATVHLLRVNRAFATHMPCDCLLMLILLLHLLYMLGITDSMLFALASHILRLEDSGRARVCSLTLYLLDDILEALAL